MTRAVDDVRRVVYAGVVAFGDGDVFEVRLRTTSASQEFVNVIHYDWSAGGGVGDSLDDVGQALADAVRDAVSTTYRALWNNGHVIDPVTVTQAKDPVNPDRTRSTWSAAFSTSSGTKTITGDNAPTALARVYSLRTPHIGRSFRGRMFVSGYINEADIGASINIWNAASAGNHAYLADAFVLSIPREPDVVFGPSTDSCRWVVYSRTRRAAELDDYTNPVTATLARAPIFWLRSRQINQ